MHVAENQTDARQTPAVLTKAEFCPRGGYAALPHRLLARTDLSPAAKLVLMAIADRIRGDATWSNPTVAELADATACAERTVRAAVGELEARGILAVERRPGRGWRMGLLAASEPRQNLPDHPGKIRRTPRQNPPDTPAKSAGVPATAEPTQTTPSASLTNLSTADTQNPPLITPPARNTRAHGARAREAPGGQQQTSTVGGPQQAAWRAIAAAYESYYETGPPPTWRRAFDREAAADRSQVFLEVSAETFRAAKSYAEKRGCTFGVAWLGMYLDEQRSARIRRQEIERVRRERQTRAEEIARRQRGDQDRQQQRRDRIIQKFRQLPEVERQRYLTAVEDRGGLKLSGRMREICAAGLAVKDGRLGERAPPDD